MLKRGGETTEEICEYVSVVVSQRVGFLAIHLQVHRGCFLHTRGYFDMGFLWQHYYCGSKGDDIAASVLNSSMVSPAVPLPSQILNSRHKVTAFPQLCIFQPHVMKSFIANFRLFRGLSNLHVGFFSLHDVCF